MASLFRLFTVYHPSISPLCVYVRLVSPFPSVSLLDGCTYVYLIMTCALLDNTYLMERTCRPPGLRWHWVVTSPRVE